MKRIAILMTVHNRKEKTMHCLQRVFSQVVGRIEYETEIFLSDDGCSDGTRQAVEKKFPSVHIVDGNGDLFWNRGMYVAWNEAAKREFDFFLWLNDDTFIYDNVINRLLESSAKHSNMAIVVGSTCAINHPEDITYGGWINGQINTQINEEYRCDTFNGNIVLVPRGVYNILGTNDPYYRHSLGDIDYGLRANKKGIQIWVAKGVMGECDRHERPTVWMDPSQPFKKRWNNFFSPLGNNPFEFFYFRYKHFGFLPACKTFITNFIHFAFPRMWLKNKNY